jgi:hypothetical protein
LYNLAANFAQGLVVFFAFVLGLEKTPLTPIQVGRAHEGLTSNA